ncbi:lysozyme inhibitor LprI family protein [Ruegeria sp. HKCCD7255]|uniref:lysozyme inhibitor LprI family protein n=1 Tax=Ruegeria sp. HKCCD7255 TaxID=2683004 RepID=UPI00148968BE|nr:lysozyme inhibitor LprI family protein [Ruegeria sp. HKCCD7255]
MKMLLVSVCVFTPLQTMADWMPEPVPESEIWDCVTRSGSDWHAGAQCIGTFSNACIESSGAYDSIAVSQCKDAEMQGWDAILNTAYNSLRADLSAPDILPIAAEALKDAQRAWIIFRDAECVSRGNLTTGTGHFEDGADCLLRVTATRALDLIGYGGTQ